MTEIKLEFTTKINKLKYFLNYNSVSSRLIFFHFFYTFMKNVMKKNKPGKPIKLA